MKIMGGNKVANQVEKTLNDEQFELLQKERYMLLSTVDQEFGGPMMNAISWIFAPEKSRVLFAVDNRSKIIDNIEKDNKVVLTLIGDESTYSIRGDAKVVTEKIEGNPLKLAGIEVKIEEVRDIMFYGAKISVEPAYEKTYDEKAATKLDEQVLEGLKQL